jgi:hypothetical protein
MNKEENKLNNMTYKEKADQLIDKVFPYVNKEDSTNNNYKSQIEAAKPLAIIVCDELIESWGKDDGAHFYARQQFYEKVKIEINNL